MRRVVKSEAILQVCPTSRKFPEVEAGQPTSFAPQHLRGNVVSGVAQLTQLRSKLSCALQIGSSPMIGKLAPQSEQQHARPVQRQRELPCPGVILAQLRYAPAPVHDKCLT